MRITILLCITLATTVSVAPLGAQANPLGGAGVERKADRDPDAAADSLRAQPYRPPPGFEGMDSVVYRLVPSSRLEVKTGKAGLFGFAGHTHVIRARAFEGVVVYYPKAPSRSRLDITVRADSLEVLTPPDTEEIRKVTEAMRTDVLQVDRYHDIRLSSRRVTPGGGGFHIVGALTLVGQTRDVPIDVTAELRPDSVRARTSFVVKQTDFGIKPYSGGPAGTVKVADRVAFTIDAVAVRSERQAATSQK